MSQVIIAGDTSGTITLQAPAVSGSTVLTLPATTATLATLTTPSFGTTIGVGGATASASGAGITFPATQSASSNANTLDDYEEGTWTPTLTFGGGSTGMVLASQKGNYTKVGNRVFITGYVALSTKGSSTGNISILGLPFASVNTSDMYNATAIWAATLTSVSGSLMAYNPPNTTSFNMHYLGTGTTTNVTHANCNNNSDFMINFSYSI